MLARGPVWRGAVSSALDEGIAGSVFMRFVAFRSRLTISSRFVVP